MQKMLTLFADVRDASNGKSKLRSFQDVLREIPGWNQHIIDVEVENLSSQTDPGLLEDLITTIMVSNAEILSAVNVSSTRNKINLKVPKMSVFVHNCYIELARKLYKNIFLFADKISSSEKQRDMQAFETLTHEAIRLAIQKALPIHDIIKQYVTAGGADPDEARTTLDNLQDPEVAHALLSQQPQHHDESSDDDIRPEKDIKIPEKDNVLLEELTLEETPKDVDPKSTLDDESISEDYIAPEDDIRPPDLDDSAIHELKYEDIFLPDTTDMRNEDLEKKNVDDDTSDSKPSSVDENDDPDEENDDETNLDDESDKHQKSGDKNSEELEPSDHKKAVENKDDHSFDLPTEGDTEVHPDDELEISFNDDEDSDLDADEESPIDVTFGGNTSEDSENEEHPKHDEETTEPKQNAVRTHKAEKKRPEPKSDMMRGNSIKSQKASQQETDERNGPNKNKEEDIDDDKDIDDDEINDMIDASTEKESVGRQASSNNDILPENEEDHIDSDDYSDDNNLPAPQEDTDFTDSEIDRFAFTDDDLYSDQDEVDDMLSSLKPESRTSSEQEIIKPKSTSKLEAFIGELAPRSYLKDRTDDDVSFSSRAVPRLTKKVQKKNTKPKTRKKHLKFSQSSVKKQATKPDYDSDTEDTDGSDDDSLEVPTTKMPAQAVRSEEIDDEPKKKGLNDEDKTSDRFERRSKINLFDDAASDSDD